MRFENFDPDVGGNPDFKQVGFAVFPWATAWSPDGKLSKSNLDKAG
jgi:hypothetical protein